jgi:hypothetical protein
MKRYLRILFVTVFMALVVSGCEKEISWQVQEDVLKKIVVEGTITSEYKSQLIRISETMREPNEIPGAISGAEVIVSTNDSVYLFREDNAKPGYYISEKKFAGKPGNEYSLFISTEGQIITGKAMMMPVTDFLFLSYGSKEAGELLAVRWVAEPYSPSEPAMYEIYLDWSLVPGFTELPADSTTARLLYYTLPTLDVSQLFAPQMEKVQFPPGTVITERKYSLTDQHAAYIRAMLAETNLQGGLFNSVPANVPLNLSNNALGYFSACDVLEKTVIAIP